MINGTRKTPHTVILMDTIKFIIIKNGAMYTVDIL